jgi:hypothetical protein
MLDGNRYFGSFPDEAAPTPPEQGPQGKAPPVTPGLLAALEELNRELRSFLDETERQQSDSP